MSTTTPVPTYFYKILALLSPGDLVRRGNFGRVIYGYGPAHTLFYREYAFESVRRREFARLPSRMGSTFVFDDEAKARAWRRATPGNLPELTYAVRPVEPNALVHRADMGWIDTLGECHTFDEIEEQARRYWRGEVHTSQQTELVVASDLTVVSRLP